MRRAGVRFPARSDDTTEDARAFDPGYAHACMAVMIPGRRAGAAPQRERFGKSPALSMISFRAA
jgi:hypothetical protein